METPTRAAWKLALKWALGIFVGLIALFVAINSFDEELSPEAKALRVPAPNPYRPEDNLYLALLGFDGPKGASPVAAGEKKLAAYEDEVAAALKDPQYRFSDFTSWGERLSFLGKIDFCQPLTRSCLPEAGARRAEVGRLLGDNRELMQRYSRLHAFKGYRETATPSIYLLPAFVPTAVRRLYFADVALQVTTGARTRQKAALAGLRDDIRTWEKQLAASESLVSKMVAVANLQGDLAMLADIIAEPKLDFAGSSMEIRAALDLVPESDWKIDSVFVHEYRVSAFMRDQERAVRGLRPMIFAGEARWWERLFDRLATPLLKVNATQNLQAEEAVQRQRMGAAVPEAFLAARDAYRSWHEHRFAFGPAYVNNPAGRVFVGMDWTLYDGYALRAYDGAAFLRLARLGYEIRSRKIGDAAIPAFMRDHPEWASHPVDGRLFLWDGNKREIAIQTLGDQPKDRRFAIPVWSAGQRPD